MMATKGNINLQLNINTQFTNVKSAVDAFQKQLSNIKIDANFSNSKGLADNFSKQADQIKAKLEEINKFDFNTNSSKNYAALLQDVRTQYAQLSAAVNDYKVSLGKEKSEVQDKLKTEQENLQVLKEKSKTEKEYIDGFQAYHKALAEAKTQNRELTEDEKLLVATYSSETRTMKQLKEDHKNTNQAKRESQAEIKKLQIADKSYTALLKTESNVQMQVKTAIETTTAARQDEYIAAKNQEAVNKSNAAQLQKQTEAQNKQAEAIRKAAEEQKKAKEEAKNNFRNQEKERINQEINSLQSDTNSKLKEYRDIQDSATYGTNNLTSALENQIIKWTSFRAIVQLAQKSIQDIVQTYQELDDNLSAISAVSGIATEQLWGNMPKMIDNANSLALSIDDLTNGMLLFYQQGLSTEETEIRLNAAGKMAAISQQDLSTAVDQLTSTMNAFNMTGEDAQNVVDVFANMAGKTATDVEELATAMARTASIAKNAGMTFEQTTAFIATMEETTRLSAETIGNSMKSIIARFQKLKTDPSSLLEDGVSANDVEKALKKADVALRDTEGNFRNIGDVIMELSAKWDTLDTNTQKYIATMAAGTQQSSNFIALVGNYQSNVDNLAYAMDSAGAAEEQFQVISSNLSSALKRLDNNLVALKTSFLGGASVLTTFVDIIATLVGALAKVPALVKDITISFTALVAIMTAHNLVAQKKIAIATLETKSMLSEWSAAAKAASGSKDQTIALVKNIEATIDLIGAKNRLTKAEIENLKATTLNTLGYEESTKELTKINASAQRLEHEFLKGTNLSVGLKDAFVNAFSKIKDSITTAKSAVEAFYAATGPIGIALTAIVAAITLVTFAQNTYTKSIQDNIDALTEQASQHKQQKEQYESSIESLNDYKEKLKEAHEKGQDLTDIKAEIARTFASETELVNATNESYWDLSRAIQEVIDKKKELASTENYEQLKAESGERKAETNKYKTAYGTINPFAKSKKTSRTEYLANGESYNPAEAKNMWQADVEAGRTNLTWKQYKEQNFEEKITYVLTDADGNKFFEGTEEEYQAKLKELASHFYSQDDILDIMSNSGITTGAGKNADQQYAKLLSLVSQSASSDIFDENGQLTEEAQQAAAGIQLTFENLQKQFGISRQTWQNYLAGNFDDMSSYTRQILDNYVQNMINNAKDSGQDLGQLGEVLDAALNNSLTSAKEDINNLLQDYPNIISQKTAEQLSQKAITSLEGALKNSGKDAASALGAVFSSILEDGVGTAIEDSTAIDSIAKIFNDIDWTDGDSIRTAIEDLQALQEQGIITKEAFEDLQRVFGKDTVATTELDALADSAKKLGDILTTAVGDGLDTSKLEELATICQQVGIDFDSLSFSVDKTTGNLKMSLSAAQALQNQFNGLSESNRNLLLSEVVKNNAVLQSIDGLDAEKIATQGLSLTEIASAQASIASKKAEIQAQITSAKAAVQAAQQKVIAAGGIIAADEAQAESSGNLVDLTSNNATKLINIFQGACKILAGLFPAAAGILGAASSGLEMLKQTGEKALDQSSELAQAQQELADAQSNLNGLEDEAAALDTASAALKAYKDNITNTSEALAGMKKAAAGKGRSGSGKGAADASNELKEALEAQKKALQEQEKALEKSKKALEEQKKALENQKKALEETNKQLQENYKLYVELIKSRLNDEIDRQTTRIEAFYDAIKDTIQSEIDSFNDQLDALKKQADELKSKADELQDAADQQENSLNKLYDAAQAYYDAAQDGLDNQIDSYDKVIDRNKEHIDLLNEQKDAIQDQIDALDTAADSESKLLALEKARDALANARNQKTRMVLTNGGGWRLRTDKSEISNAQSNLASAQRDYQKEILERQQKKIEEQTDEIEKQNNNLENIKSDLEDQKDALDDIKDQWDKAQDALGKTTSELEEQTNLIRQFQYGNDASRQDQLSNFSGQVSNNNQQQQAASDATNRANEASNKYDQQSNEDVQGSIAEAIKKLEEQQNQADEALKQYFENQLSNNAETAQIQQEMKDLINQMVNGQIGQLENFAQFYETINGALEQANTNASQTADYINNINAAIDRYDEWSNRLDMTTDEINQRQAIMNEINNATLSSLLEGGSTFGQLQGQYEQIVRNNDEAEKIQDQIDGLDEQANVIQAQIDALKEQENKISEQEKELSNANSNKTANAAKAAGNTAAIGARTAGAGVQQSVDNAASKISRAIAEKEFKVEVHENSRVGNQGSTRVGNKQVSAIMNVGGTLGFSRGGVDDVTRTVAVHGTKNRPELILNNSQSAALFKYIDSMTRIPTLSSAGSARNALMGFGTTNNTNNNGTNFTNCEFNVESNADNLDSLVQDLKQSASIRR